MFDNVLFVIPARGGSKGLLGKNIKLFLGKPLIHYSIEYARLFVSDENICLTTDDESIVACAEEIGLTVPFLRPPHLATDTADTFSVLKHAYKFYSEKFQNKFELVVLLQPTSPIRAKYHLEESIALYDKGVEMVVSVCESKSNPYFTLFEETPDGFLRICKGDNSYTRRQDTPTIYEFNGSIYLINPNVLVNKRGFSELKNIIKYLMNDYYSVDIDTINDWKHAENLYSVKK